MADIAKAYVQIIPTTKDIASNIKNALNGSDMEKAGNSIGANMAEGIKKAIIGAGIGAFIGKTIGDAIKNGANFEQLYGGAEKIFEGMDINRILKDSVEAYKTMGMSANKYLEVINDVGAGFKASMGSKEGYKTAQKGLQAISDYASGTGKNVDLLSQKFTMITRATSSYQSIADQFSGILPATSKAFLEQAQAAGDLGTQYKTLTEVPIAEYQKAVSNALERGVSALNLAGNTAKEASETVSGSFTAMRAAWENFTTSLVIPEINTKQAFSNFIKSFGDLIHSLTPLINEMIPNIANVISQAIIELTPELLNILGTTIGEVIKAIPSMFSQLDFGGLVVLIGGVTLAFLNLAPAIGAATAAMAGFDAASLANPVGLVIIAVVALGYAIWALVEAMEVLYDTNESFRSTIDRMDNAFRKIGATIKDVDSIVSFLKNQIETVKKLVEKCLKDTLTLVKEKVVEIKNNLIEGINSAIQGAKDIIPDFVKSIVEGFKNTLDAIKEWKDNLVKSVKEALDEVIEKISDFSSITKKFDEIGKQMAEGLQKGFKDNIEKVKKGITDEVNKIVKKLKEVLGIKSPSRVFADQIGSMMAAGLSVGFSDGMERFNSSLNDEITASVNVGTTSVDNALRSTPDTSRFNNNTLDIERLLNSIVIQNNIKLEGDAEKLFKSVVDQNKIYTNSTGRSAFS